MMATITPVSALRHSWYSLATGLPYTVITNFTWLNINDDIVEGHFNQLSKNLSN